MQKFIAFLGLWFLITESAPAVDLCPIYKKAHDAEVIKKIKSGIPFKLLGIASNGTVTYKRIIHVQYDLWKEQVSIESVDGARSKALLTESGELICRAITSMIEQGGGVFRFQLLLNPVLGEGLKQIGTHNQQGRLLHINWDEVAKKLETEKTLIDTEVRP